MILIDSVSGVNAELQENAYQTARNTIGVQSDNASTSATFEEVFRQYARKTENTAFTEKESSRDAEIYMSYYLPAMLMQGTDARQAYRNLPRTGTQKSGS